MFMKRFQLKLGIGADLIFSRYIYGTEKLCHKGTLYRVMQKGIARFGDMVYDVLQKKAIYKRYAVSF